MQKTIFGQKCLVINDEGKILLLQRSDYKGDAGKWDLIGGSVDFGEDALTSIKREAEEEVALSIEPEVIHLHSRLTSEETFFIFALYVSNTYDHLKEGIELSSEHTDYQWADLKTLENLNLRESVSYVLPAIKEYLETQ